MAINKEKFRIWHSWLMYRAAILSELPLSGGFSGVKSVSSDFGKFVSKKLVPQ